MHLYMLDTDICSYIIKKHPVSVLAQFEQLKTEQLCISVVTYAELHYGVTRSTSQKVNLPIVENFTSRLIILPWNKNAAVQYGQLRTSPENDGIPIGCMDMMIAAHALAQECTLVTNNLKHFQRIPQLHVENWVKLT